MNMRVDKARRDKFSLRVENFFTVVNIFTHADNFSVKNRNFAVRNFAAQNVDNPAIFYN